MPRKVQISIDRGGTFTDVWANFPGEGEVVFKLLSEDPGNYSDAPTEGVRLVLERLTGQKIEKGRRLDGKLIEWIRMGTTVATNALLERKGDRFLYATTEFLGDVLEIGTQARPRLFDLNVQKPVPLYSEVLEIEERVTLETASDDPNQTPVETNDKNGVFATDSGHFIRVLKPLNHEKTFNDLLSYYNKGFRNIAVCLAHSFAYEKHEREIRDIAEKIGYKYISLSSELSPSIGLLNRGNSVCLSAYLTPRLQNYVDKFMASFDDCPIVEFMKSDGGLVYAKGLNGLNSILSGPAGGVVGLAKTAYNGKNPIIGFDMGGTSTDVCRYDKDYEVVYENKISGVDIVAPQLQIHTVAAGGGSILQFESGLYHVGPESSGAHPGPACYRKGGPLTVTDANLFLNRLDSSRFPRIFGPNANQPLDRIVVEAKFKQLTSIINLQTNRKLSPQEVSLGFLRVANETMARSIREISEARGYSTNNHILSAFGGAGGQHCCSIARILGMRNVIIHKYSSVLSSYGMANASRSHELREPFHHELSEEVLGTAIKRTSLLRSKIARLFESTCGLKDVSFNEKFSLGLKFKNSNTLIHVSFDEKSVYGSVLPAFLKTHEREFGFLPSSETPVVVDYIHVRGVLPSSSSSTQADYLEEIKHFEEVGFVHPQPQKQQQIFFNNEPSLTNVYQLEDLVRGSIISGPALITEDTQTILIEPDCRAIITASHVCIELFDIKQLEASKSTQETHSGPDPTLLSIFSHRFMGIAEQMGRTLQRTSVSTSIKERLDFSCAIFGADGGLVANAPHIPIHLGSMQYAIQYQHQLWKDKLAPGDVLLSNHPEAGGTHLPDLTVITPVFKDGDILFYVASRGHHQDIGGRGITAMMPNSKELWHEGVSVKSFRLVEGGRFDDNGIRDIFEEPAKYPGSSKTRSIEHNLSDLKAQISANQRGITLVENLIEEYGPENVQYYMKAIRNNAEDVVREFLKKQSGVFEGAPLVAEDYFDDGTRIKVKITIDPKKGDAFFDFDGTGSEVYGCMNSPPSITYSCVLYVLRCLINKDIPLNQGCLKPCKFNIPKGSILNPTEFVAICGSTISGQRITDVLLKAFNSCAASQGCANSFGFGTGGKDPVTGETTKGFTYAEAIGGGVGAGPWGGVAADACNVHCTNTRTTDVEIIEHRTPVVVTKWQIRRGSGGDGKFKGGNGCIRELEARIPLKVSILSERRVFAPYGLNGGQDGTRGLNLWFRKQDNGAYALTNIGNKQIFSVSAGDRVQINTPGGGGYGEA